MSSKQDIKDGSHFDQLTRGLVYTERLGWIDLASSLGWLCLRYRQCFFRKWHITGLFMIQMNLLQLLKKIIVFAVAALIVCWFFIWLIASGINSGTVYLQSDYFTYFMLTDKEIKNAPRITRDYRFESQPGDGYAASNAITFSGTTNPEAIRNYLMSLGYVRDRNSKKGREIWIRPNAADTCFSIDSNVSAREITLTKFSF